MDVPTLEYYSHNPKELNKVWVVWIDYLKSGNGQDEIKIFKYKEQAEEFIFNLISYRLLNTGEGTLKHNVNRAEFSYRLFEEIILIRRGKN